MTEHSVEQCRLALGWAAHPWPSVDSTKDKVVKAKVMALRRLGFMSLEMGR
jgi:hypothetical protein